MPFVTIKQCRNCGVSHEWEFDAPTLKELRTIKKLTGFAGLAFGEAISESDPEALAALLYILHERDKISVPFDDVDLDFNDFEMRETDAEVAEREALEAGTGKGKGAGHPVSQPGRTSKAG